MRIQRSWVTAIACCLALSLTGSAHAFRLGQRWTTTATNGGGLSQGTPTTLTWSFVPDGTNIPNEGLSDLISAFDTRFGAGPGGTDLTQRPWFTYFDLSFQRWGELGGLSYVYEPNDDGVSHQNFPGSLGTRGDLRIAGNFIDGPSNVLAYNFFPNNGDMVLDTGDMAFFGTQGGANYRQLRNTVMHEHGHGMGLNHVESNNARFLMEPFLSTQFDGPQLDDIRGMHRGYGDKYEKNGGNNTAATATDLGVFGGGDSFSVGTNGRFSLVGASQVDFLSIDDNSDMDYMGFTLSANSMITISAEPIGPSYLEGPQGGSQSTINAAQISDLTLALIGTDQSTVLATSNIGGLGVTETIADFDLDAGTYYARITGTANNIQMYQFDLSVTEVMNPLDGDFNDDGFWNCDDINSLTATTAAMSNDPDFDLTGDGLVNSDDIMAWLAEGGANNPTATGGNPFLVGDADLNGDVDGVDFIEWNMNKFTANTNWCDGNFNGDASVDGLDFIEWNANKFTSSDAINISLVPEPSSLLMVFVALTLRRRLPSQLVGWRRYANEQ